MLNNLSYSANGLKLTKGFEGTKLKAYQDIIGVWTIGNGHTKGVKQGDCCTQEQSDKWLLEDVQACVDAINANAKVKLTQNQFDALVDFAFNLGIGALLKSTLWRKLNAGDPVGAAAEFGKWINAGGQRSKGLERRREAERILFLTP